MCSCDYDLAAAYATAFRVAKLPHCCYECHRTIAPKETYRFTSGVWVDNIPFNLHTCIGCSAAVDWLDEHCGCWLHGDIEEEIRGHIEDGHKGLGRVLVMMRRFWRRKDGSLYDPPKLVKFEWKKMRRDGFQPRWERVHEGSPF